MSARSAEDLPKHWYTGERHIDVSLRSSNDISEEYMSECPESVRSGSVRFRAAFGAFSDHFLKFFAAETQPEPFFEECVSAGDTTVEFVNVKLLAEAISRFLRTLPPEARNTFVGRYYFMDTIGEIASYCGMSAAKTKSMLHRTRLGLKAYLEQEGFK